jgi:hypothetical protein
MDDDISGAKVQKMNGRSTLTIQYHPITRYILYALHHLKPFSARNPIVKSFHQNTQHPCIELFVKWMLTIPKKKLCFCPEELSLCVEF